jgi:hypothetical protein
MEFTGTLTSEDGKAVLRATGEWLVVGLDKWSGTIASSDGLDIALNATYRLTIDGGGSALIIVKNKSGADRIYFEGVGKDPPSGKSSTQS